MKAVQKMKGVIVGYGSEEHVGAHFLSAASSLDLDFSLVESSAAFTGPRVLQKAWWLADRRPIALRAFGLRLVEELRSRQARILLATGIAPVDAETLRVVRQLGVHTINFLTDDPWNPAHRARWFMEALPAYHTIYSPRRANISDLVRAGGADVRYLPFGYNPNVHFHQPPVSSGEQAQLRSQVVFAGGADRDRIPWIEHLIAAGVDVALYGGYWSDHGSTKASARGIADIGTIRRAVSAADVALCVVRRSNRDGHAMRSFELPAMHACMLVERTPEHEDLFGADGDAVVYFETAAEMVQHAIRLLGQPDERQRLSDAVSRRITSSSHTYSDRLSTMLAGLA